MDNFNDIRTGVIGVGSMGQNHARVYNKISNLIAVADPNEEQGRKVANRLGVEWYSDYTDILDKVDAVTIAVPTSMHLAVSQKVAEAGVSMLIEKPLASNVSDAKAILEISKKYDITMAVGHIERHNPVINLAKHKIENNEWGDLITLNSRRVSNFPERIHDVGVLFDLLIHDLDISNYLVNSSVSIVYAAGGQMKAKHEDYANVLMTFSNGVVSVSEANWLTPMKIRKLGLTTSTNYIELDYQNQSVTLFNSRYVNVNPQNLFSSNVEFDYESIPVKKEEPLLSELRDFLSSFANKKEPLVSVKEGLEVVNLSEVALTSLKTSKSIKMDM